MRYKVFHVIVSVQIIHTHAVLQGDWDRHPFFHRPDTICRLLRRLHQNCAKAFSDGRRRASSIQINLITSVTFESQRENAQTSLYPSSSARAAASAKVSGSAPPNCNEMGCSNPLSLCCAPLCSKTISVKSPDNHWHFTCALVGCDQRSSQCKALSVS